MQAWLQPMHASTSARRPVAAFSTSSGSAISARVIPTASAAPDSTRRSAALRSTTRVVAISGTPTASRSVPSDAAIAVSATGGGGAIQLDAAT